GVMQRVITEQAEVSGTASRRDSRSHVPKKAACRLRGESMEIRQARGLHLGFAGAGVREAGEAVQREQDDLRRVRDDERAEQIEHGGQRVPKEAAVSRRSTGGPRARPTVDQRRVTRL